VVPGARTGTSVHLLAGDDRAIYTERGAMVELTGEDAIAHLDPAPRHVHLAAIFLLPHVAADGARIVAAARAAGATVSVDTNFDPAGLFAAPPWLTDVDVLLPNETEALRLSGRDGSRSDAATVEAAARELAGGGALVVVKRGAAGAFAVADGRRLDVGVAPTASPVVDAVGAGDSFDAGFVRALLDGRGPHEALALASACGTLSTRAAGGTAGQATLAEATALAREVPA
jgi:sugar/nucleoside kinase (ribokinase family)